MASPSDLQHERDVALDVQNRVNHQLVKRGGLAHLMTWEQVPSTAGRPQKQINEMVDECDLFIGMLHQKWGTPTGQYSSGFEEEFERALTRRTRTGAPNIALYYKLPKRNPPAALRSDLKKIEAFKQRHSQLRIKPSPYPLTASFNRSSAALASTMRI